MINREEKSKMKKTTFILLLIVLPALFLSCSTIEKTGRTELGDYSYRSYDMVGTLVGEGSLYIVKSDSGTVEGNWSIRNVHNCSTCGSQFGSGYLTGQIKNDSIYINLNPDYPESYTELTGKLQNGNISGEWLWTNLIVASNRGTFKAEKY